MREDVTTDRTSETTASASGAVIPISPPGYDLLEEVGRGGMGVVYRARDTALGRDVAVKALTDRYAPGSPAAQRFLNEARITGQLQHPGIPPVHQVGVMSDGRPFLAMKLIKGCTLEQILKDRSDPAADLGRLLAAFEAICQALGYAHAHQVIHRDLKPANIMVGAFNEVQVMDWGLAKVLGAETPPAGPAELVAEQTRAWTEISPTPEPRSYTQAGSLVGTAAFVAPEQAAGELDKVNERADVFGLGAILAVVLTGKPPYVGESFESVRVMAMRGKLDDCFARLDASGAEPELVALCKRCLALEPQDRPRDAGEVAQTVAGLRTAAEERARSAERQQAAAAAQAIEQRRRRRWQYAAASLVILALVGAILGLGVYLQAQAKASAEMAVKNAELAAANNRERQRFELAMDAIGLFTGDVSDDLLLKEKKFERLRAKLLRGAADFYGKLEGLLEGQTDPKSRAALAASYTRLADVTTQIGKGDDALALQLKALAIRRELASRPGADEEATLDLVRSLYSTGRANLSLGKAPSALALIGEATALAEGLEAKGRPSHSARKRLAECLNYTSILLNESRPEVRNPTRAMECNERALTVAEELAAANPGENESNELLSAIVTQQGILLHDRSRWAEAAEAQRRAMAIAEQLAEANPQSSKYRELLGRSCWNLVGKLSSLGKGDEAIAVAEKAIRNWQKVADANPAVMTYQNNLAFGLNGLAYHLAERGEFTRAMEAHQRARAIMKVIAEADPSVVGFQRNLARSQAEIGWLWLQIGRPKEALPELLQERATRRRMEAADPTNAAYRDDIANCETNLALAFLLIGKPSEAREACDRAIAIRQRLIRDDLSATTYRAGQGESFLRSGQLRRSTADIPGAAADWRRAIALFEGLPPRSGDIAGLEAGCHAMLSSLAGLPGAGVSVSDGAGEADKAMTILRGVVANGFRAPLLRVEPALDPLRDRPDFQALMKEVALPAD